MALLKYIWDSVKALGEILASITNFILMTLIYFLGVGPTSLFTRLFHKELLDSQPDKKAKTYWRVLSNNQKAKDYKKQF